MQTGELGEEAPVIPASAPQWQPVAATRPSARDVITRADVEEGYADPQGVQWSTASARLHRRALRIEEHLSYHNAEIDWHALRMECAKPSRSMQHFGFSRFFTRARCSCAHFQVSHHLQPERILCIAATS